MAFIWQNGCNNLLIWHAICCIIDIQMGFDVNMNLFILLILSNTLSAVIIILLQKFRLVGIVTAILINTLIDYLWVINGG